MNSEYVDIRLESRKKVDDQYFNNNVKLSTVTQ